MQLKSFRERHEETFPRGKYLADLKAVLSVEVMSLLFENLCGDYITLFYNVQALILKYSGCCWSQSYQRISLIMRDYLEDWGIGVLFSPSFYLTGTRAPCPKASCAEILDLCYLHELL